MDIARRFAHGSAAARDAAVAAAGLAAILLWAFLVSVAPFPLWYVSAAGLLAPRAAALAVLVYILLAAAAHDLRREVGEWREQGLEYIRYKVYSRCGSAQSTVTPTQRTRSGSSAWLRKLPT